MSTKTAAENAGVVNGGDFVLVPLSLIHSAINPKVHRNPAPGLVESGRCPVDKNDKPTPLALIHSLALSDDAEKRAEYVALIDEYEGGGADSIRELADSPFGLKNRQIQAITLVPYRVHKGDGYELRYRVIAGERRVLAMAYLFAKYGSKYGKIKAETIGRCNKDKAKGISIAENFLRLNPAPSEVAFTYLALKQDGMGIGDIAEYFFGNDPRKTKSSAYQHVRGMLKLVSGANKLEPAELAKVDNGVTGLTKAINQAQGRGKADDKKVERRRTWGLRQCEGKFDEVLAAPGKMSAEQTGYLKCLADCMGIDLDTACAESRDRLEAAAPVAEAA